MPQQNILTVEAPSINVVAKALQAVPKYAKSAISNSIKDALKAARTTLIGRGPAAESEGIRSRYNIPYNKLLSAIGQPRTFGMSGQLNITGHRLPLWYFPSRDISPYGTATAELKDAPPANMLHAFMRNGIIYQREGRGTPRLPIHWVMGLSVAEMAKESKTVYPKVKARMEEQLAKRLWHYLDLQIKAVAQGTPITGFKKGKPIYSSQIPPSSP